MSTVERPSRREVVTRLQSAQKSSRGAGAYSRWINRPLGRQAAAFAYLCGLKPNQISVISAVFSYLGIAALATLRPSAPVGCLVAIGLIIGYVLDSADGQVARLCGGGSVDGEWLDHVIDAAKVAALHSAVVICWYRYYHIDRGFLLIPLSYGLVATVFFFAIVLSDLLRRVASAKAGGAGTPTASVNPNEAAPWLRSVLVLPNDYGLMCVAFFLLGLHSAFVWIYIFLFISNFILLLVASVRWFREMRALSTPLG